MTKDKLRKKLRHEVKQSIYNSIISGEDADDECMACAWYGSKCFCGKLRNGKPFCRQRQVKVRKATMKKLVKYKKEHKEWLSKICGLK